MNTSHGDHQYPIRDAISSRLEDLNPENREEGDEEGDCTTDVLSYDAHIVLDVMLTVGGPTCYWQVTADPDGEITKISYVDSWAHPVQEIRLSEEEAEAVASAHGLDDPAMFLSIAGIAT